MNKTNSHPQEENNHLGFFTETTDDFILDLRPIGIHEIAAIAHSSRKKAQAPTTIPHIHSNLEICLLISGIRTNRSGDETWYLNEGDLWINKPGIPHSSSLSPSGPSSIYYLEIRPPAPGETFAGLPPGETAAFWQRWLNLPPGPCRCDKLCAELFHETIRRARNTASITPAHLRALIHALLFSILTLFESAPAHILHPAIQKTRALIDASSPENQPSLEALASHAGLSLPHFKTLFKRNIGVPPAKFLQSRRLAAVAYQLITTDDDLAQIARRFAFSSAQYFSNVFKAYSGETPQKYREAHRLTRQKTHV